MKKITDFFLKDNFRFNIRNLSYLPRWIILFIDISILLFSFFITNLIFEKSGIVYGKFPINYNFLAVFSTLNIISFWIFKTYSGIIRHSSYIDAIKLMFSQMLVFLILVSVNFSYDILYNQKLFLYSAIVVNLVFSFCGLFIYRMLVKQVFERYFSENNNSELTKTIIFGADANAISVAKALKTESPVRFKIVAFVDKKDKHSAKLMLNLPILTLKKKLPVLMRSVGANAVIIADKSISEDEKSIIVDQCLEFGYKVFNLPTITDWNNQKEISKKVKEIQIEDLLNRVPIVLDSKKISAQTKNKTILITGAAGSIGSEITNQVLGFGPHNIILLDQAETPLHSLNLNIERIKQNANVFTEIVDIRNRTALKQVFEKYRPEMVYHAAAYKHVPLMEHNPSQAIFTNVMGTKFLADLSCEFGVKKFVMISTDKAVNPSNVMGASKRIAEKYVQSLQFKKSQTKFITTRFGNVLGSNGSVVPLFTKQIAEGGPITVTHKDIIRYFMTIPEACQLVLEAGAMGNGGEIYIFDMGKPVKIIDLAKKMIMLAGFVPYKDIDIKEVGLRPGEKLYEELLNDNTKTLPTHHEKIMIAQESFEDFELKDCDINCLIETANQFENQNIVMKMKQIVPEFRSMNSIYETLDKSVSIEN